MNITHLDCCLSSNQESKSESASPLFLCVPFAVSFDVILETGATGEDESELSGLFSVFVWEFNCGVVSLCCFAVWVRKEGRSSFFDPIEEELLRFAAVPEVTLGAGISSLISVRSLLSFLCLIWKLSSSLLGLIPVFVLGGRVFWLSSNLERKDWSDSSLLVRFPFPFRDDNSLMSWEKESSSECNSLFKNSN